MPGEKAYLVLDEKRQPAPPGLRARRPRSGAQHHADALVVRRVGLGGTGREPAQAAGRSRPPAGTRSDRRVDREDRPLSGGRPGRRDGRQAQLGRRLAGSTRSGTAAPAASPTWSPPFRGCRRERRSPPPSTSPVPAPPHGSARSRGRADEGDGGAVGPDPDLAGPTPRRTSATSVPRRVGDAPASTSPRSTASPPGGCRPGQVPPRPGRPVARHGARRQPARRRGARPLGDWWRPGPAWSSPPALSGRRALSTVAAIDCGTNSIKVLIGDVRADGTLDVVLRDSRVVRLGQGVDRTGVLADEALERTFAALDEFAAVIPEHGVPRGCASAPPPRPATRERRGLLRGVRGRLGVEPEVLSGDEEASLVFDGAVGRRTRAAEPVLVSTSAGARRNWCWGRRPSGIPSRWTSARSVCTSATSTPTRRRPPRSMPASPTSTGTSMAAGRHRRTRTASASPAR